MTQETVGDMSALLERVSCVLFDFDGPLADLFARYPAAGVAETLRVRAMKLGVRSEELSGVSDPLRVLRIVATCDASRHVTSELEKCLAQEEVCAAETALPTPHAARLVSTLAKSGRKVAITTNNSAEAASAYLDRIGLLRYFGRHVYGRADDPGLLKPDPHCLMRAMACTGAVPENCLMIGDSPSDLRAAELAGVRFLGFARDEPKSHRLYEAGAKHVVTSLGRLSAAAVPV
ncbi:HAD family hydrolase [Actinacidiphila sp. bgisy160]|uniref:HAD family hydrolase n=1 Tax=Actinacidiphila sp. bgisy160 TaxID=3413796 RepID=UPI003D73ABD5